MDILSDEIESILFMAREVLVYKIPPRTSAEGYKASTWENFIWKGRMRVLEIGDRCEIKLEDGSTGELFALTKYEAPYKAVEPVLDSSRYFVLRVEGDGNRKAYIGLGFEERGEAFDFNVALQTFTKRLSSAKEVASNSSSSKPAAPPKDYSLKDGQTFSIKIPGREGRKEKTTESGGPSLLSGGGAGGIPMLAPPPPSSRKR